MRNGQCIQSPIYLNVCETFQQFDVWKHPQNEMRSKAFLYAQRSVNGVWRAQSSYYYHYMSNNLNITTTEMHSEFSMKETIWSIDLK